MLFEKQVDVPPELLCWTPDHLINICWLAVFIWSDSFIASHVAQNHLDVLILPHQTCCHGHWRSTILLQNHVCSHAVIWPQNKEPPSLTLLIWCYHMAGKMDHKGSIKCLSWGQPAVYCYIICFQKRDYWAALLFSPPHIKFDEKLTFKLQHTLFLFCSRSFEMH